MPSRKPTNYVSLLQCGHSAFYDPPPKAGDEVYCRRCESYTKVAVSSLEWAWHCPLCHLTRPFGTDENAARAGGRRHQRKYHHVVMLRKGYDTVELIEPIGQGELSIAEERIEWVRGHQGALRAFVDKQVVTGVHKGRST